jgi:hypothetical protein
MKLDKRPPYKVTKTSIYWPRRTREERQSLLRSTWLSIFSRIAVDTLDLKEAKALLDELHA